MQFNHRLLATVTAALALVTVAWGLTHTASRVLRRALLGMGAAVGAQYALGVATLLWVVPVSLGTAHQGMAVLVLTAALVLVHVLRPAPAPEALLR